MKGHNGDMTTTSEPPDGESANETTGEMPPIPDNEPEFRDTGDTGEHRWMDEEDESRFADEDEQEHIEHDPESEAEGE